MSLKTVCLHIALFTASNCVVGQQTEIIVSGKVMDALTHKGVKAQIFYKSIPTGSITGRFRDSVYSFSIFGSSKYMVAASADGYVESAAIVDPKELKGAQQLERNILLTKKGDNIILDHLVFEQGKAVIDPKSFSSLDEVVVMMMNNERLVIQLEGHTDVQGVAKLNMELSQSRVDNVKKYMVSKGIDKDRVKTKAFGGTRPLGNTPELRAANRRVEMRILKD